VDVALAAAVALASVIVTYGAEYLDFERDYRVSLFLGFRGVMDRGVVKRKIGIHGRGVRPGRTLIDGRHAIDRTVRVRVRWRLPILKTHRECRLECKFEVAEQKQSEVP